MWRFLLVAKHVTIDRNHILPNLLSLLLYNLAFHISNSFQWKHVFWWNGLGSLKVITSQLGSPLHKQTQTEAHTIGLALCLLSHFLSIYILLHKPFVSKELSNLSQHTDKQTHTLDTTRTRVVAYSAELFHSFACLKTHTTPHFLINHTFEFDS